MGNIFSQCKTLLRKIPMLGRVLIWIRLRVVGPALFPGSKQYWERRYANGGNSGCGSYSHLAEFKAEVLNDFVKEKNVSSVIEHGCGDGNQLELAQYPKYTGFDVSRTALALCSRKFQNDASKTFLRSDMYSGQEAELALSLDVIYHLVEDALFDKYMRILFASAKTYVIVYSSNDEKENSPPHIRHRRFTDWMSVHAPEWTLCETIKNEFPDSGDHASSSFADFYFFQKLETPTTI